MKRKKKINNILVHLFLSVLAIIWVSPLFWIILTSFRAQKGAYTSSFFPKKYTFNNYIKLFTDTGIVRGILYVAPALSFKKADDEYCNDTRTVSGIYGDDCGLLYFKSSWTFRRLHDSCGTDTGLLRFVRNPVLYCKRIF